MSLFRERTVDSIVSGLGDMVKQLDRHADEKEHAAEGHFDAIADHTNRAAVAKGHATRARLISSKINALVS